jgi:hypothetical protein
VLALPTKIVSRGLAGADKIAHGLVSGVRRPHARQFAGPTQPRQRFRIPSIRFYPLARPFRNQSRSDNHAFVAERLELAIKPISRWPSFKADMQPVVPTCQSLDRPIDRQRTVVDVAEKPDFSGPPPSCDRVLLRDVESHEDFAILSHGPPSVHEARLGMPEQPSFSPARKGGPPVQPANMTSKRATTPVQGVVFFCHSLLRVGISRRPWRQPRSQCRRQKAAHIVLPWAHRIFSNLKVSALGVYHGLRIGGGNPRPSADSPSEPRRRSNGWQAK